ncbi:MAG: hypothetical protein ACK2UP_21370 [Candidatus Promineifilaceae bacterium]|jgi:predicted flap endonuclease-1-like 5' DNA nuclease
MMAYQVERKRNWAVYVLFFLALIAAVLAFVDAGRYMGWIPVQATIPGLGEISFINPNASWFGAAMAGLLGIIWLLVASWLWTLNPSGWLFMIIISVFNLILQVLALLGGTTFSQVLPAVLVNGLVLLLALLPGTRDAFTARRITAVPQVDRDLDAAAGEVLDAPPVIEDEDFEAVVEAGETDAPAIEETPEPAVPDRGVSAARGAHPLDTADLTIVEGIGPKISAALAAVGINSIYKLSAVSADELREILKDAGLSADPTTWPVQAQMAADGDLAALKVYQAALVGGREA